MMRRKDREITDKAVIEDIIRRSITCRLAMCLDDMPYVVPLSFGYENNTLYFHCAREGRKLDILRENSNVCFEFDIDQEIILAEGACRGSVKYKSVVGHGKATIIDNDESKRHGLNIIMRQYANQESFQFDDKSVADCLVIKVNIESITGKISGY